MDRARVYLFGVVVLLVGVAAACSTSRARRSERSRAAAAERPVDNPGIVALRQSLADFDAALKSASFDAAADVLQGLERQIKNADVQMITHRDYNDLAAAVRAARENLANARRDSVAAKLIAATAAQLAAADKLLTEIADGGPSAERLKRLDATLDRLRELADEGRPQRKTPSYRDFAADLDKRLVALSDRALKHHWQLEATTALTAALADLADADKAVSPDQDLEAALDRLAKNRAALARCLEAVTAAKGQKDVTPALKLTTVFGTLTLQETEAGCSERDKQAAVQEKRATWMVYVQGVVAKVAAAVDKLGDTKTPALALAGNEAAVPLFKTCEQMLNRIGDKAGFDAAVLFTTPLGKLQATKLAEACGAEAKKALGLRPSWHWRIAAEQARAELEEANREMQEAAAEADQKAKATALKAAITGYERCEAQAKGLYGLKDERRRDAKPAAGELQAVRDLAARCRAEQQKGDKLLQVVKANLDPKAAAAKPGDYTPGAAKPETPPKRKPKKKR
ncbi:MAG: hypothetical protein HY903_12725 [Deltaproteobacteria bacterium]|nr:hypothetical protein [Deltaproteobacteria bacterium]